MPPQIDIGVTTPNVTRSRAMSLTDADAGRATAALKKAFSKETDTEAWDAFFDQVRTFLVQTVRNVETQAAQEAVSVNDITVS